MIQTLFRLLRPALSQPGLKLQDFEKHQTDATELGEHVRSLRV